MLAFLIHTRNVLLRQRNQESLEGSRSLHGSKGLLPSGKVIESYVAPPGFFLTLWALFPLLMLATLQPSTIVTSVFATIVNLVMINHLDAFRGALYLLCGLVLLLVIGLYHFGYV